MPANHPQWPRQWLMTDERIDEHLFDAIGRLPAGRSGIVFRHHGTPPGEREELASRVAERAFQNSLVLAIASDVGLAERLGAALVHNPSSSPGSLPASASAHSPEEARAAEAAGASLIFLSPMFATRSHPGRPPLDRALARQIVATSRVPVIALGGMDATRFDALRRDGFYGWAGIDGWLGRDQNLNAVPT